MPRKMKNKEAPKAEAIPSKKALFDDESSNSSEDDQEDGGVTINGAKGQDLKINEDYARRFEHNKKREEMHRLEEKYKSKDGAIEESEESSTDEDEDDEGFLVTEQLDAEIMATLRAIKNKDPRIYDKDAVFYKPFDPEAEPKKEKTEKPVTLRDYHRERYMAGDVGADEDDDEVKPKTYNQEQEDLRKSILADINAAADDEEWSDDDAFIKKAEKSEVKLNEDGMHPSRVVAPVKVAEVDVAIAEKNPEEFLEKFMASKAWAPPDGSNWKAFDSDEEEEDEVDIADQFENAYNMRFEDPTKANEFLKTYSRNAAAVRSVRQEELKGRKRLRALEKEKKEAEKKQREEERARLRRLKVGEAAEKLAKIKKAAGLTGKNLKEEDWAKLLDDAYDDDKWEEEMKKQFGDEYYNEADDFSANDEEDEEAAEEEEEEGAAKKKNKKKVSKPKWDDDIDIKDLIPDFEDEEKPKVALTSDDEEDATPAALPAPDSDSEEEEDARPSKKRKTTKDIKNERIAAKRQARAELAKIEALVDTKMELENPTALSKKGKGHKSVGGFRYRETSPNVFGMTARDILLAPSDAALNEFAGLKKLAPFRDAEKKRKDKKRLGKKARLREWRREQFGRDYERTGPTFGFTGEEEELKKEGDVKMVDAPAKEEVAAEQESGVVDGERKKKRKRSKKSKKAVTAEDFEDDE